MLNTQAILIAIQEQINTPARACINSESIFVKDRLSKMGLVKESDAYWSWVTMTCSADNQKWVTEEIKTLQHRLTVIDKKQSIPAWGTYGV